MRTYSEILRAPDAESRGLTRWWWYGCAVTEDEIERELDYMRDAGMGGVELQILYAVEADDEEKGIYNIPFGSPRFFEILAFTKKACDERGMTFDVTPGSSWPYGGAMITDEDAQQEAIPYQLDLHGPQVLSMDFTTRFAGDVIAATLGKMEHCVMLPETVRDVTANFRVKELFGWPWGTELVDLEVPEGDWKLTFFVISMHRNRVGKPGRDAEGRVIDHCSRHATDTFLTHMVEPIAQHVPGINAWFCDSIEVEGHNWSGELMKAFRERRGYDLTPYIYALWGDMGEITPRIRYDYFKTMGELTIENFFDPLTEFAHKYNGLMRIQAHGTWGDILRVYAAADIPEGETFGDHRTLEVNTIHRRLAASAGHVYGKNIISNETFTWLKRPRFTETLEEMKAAVDAVFCDGINMIVNHGYAYSPASAGKRGWPFYASTHINHTTPWWPHYKKLGDYIASVSGMLRKGQISTRVAVYLPQADIYADNMMSELHLAMRLEEHLGRADMDAIQKAGYWFDYINDEAIVDLNATERYEAILLVGCTRMPAETARKLREYHDRGGKLICAEQKPSMGCGLIGYDEETAAVRAAFDADIPVTEDRRGALIGCLKSVLTPDVVLTDCEHIGWVHRVDGDNHIYFMTNLSETDTCFEASFLDRTEFAQVLSPVSGENAPFCRVNENTLGMKLAPHQTVFVIFSPKYTADAAFAAEEKKNAMEITGWTLEIPEVGRKFEMDKPVSWETLEGLKHYSGVGVYRAKATVDADMTADIVLENVSCAAELLVNGEIQGTYWTRPLTLTAQLKEGENEIEIRAASTLINEMMASDGHDVTNRHPVSVPGWPYYGKVIDNQLAVRMNLNREHEEQKEVLPSGIWGGVKLVW